MQRSSKEAWLQGPGDLREAEVTDVPVKGSSVLVRGLSARYAAEVQAQMKLVQEGQDQIAKIDLPRMELLQFVNGCIDPRFTEAEAAQIQERFGPAFRKVIAKIDELSGIDKEAIDAVEQRFPAGGVDEVRGPEDADRASAGSAGPDLPVRVGA
jgi:hypothetical protein